MPAVGLLLPLAVFCVLVHPIFSNETETVALLELKSSLTNTSSLSSWSPTSPNPCDPTAPWAGIICRHGHVFALKLDNMGLSGFLDNAALARLPLLRSLSLSHNAFSGPIPAIAHFPSLRSVFFDHNAFNGSIPDTILSRMYRLKKLRLNDNQFVGRIPSSLSNSTVLRVLRLENNRFSGPIPDLPYAYLVEFDVSNNSLSGPVPSSLARFNLSSFAGNPNLSAGAEAPAPEPAPMLTADNVASEKVAAIFALVLIACLLPSAILRMKGRRVATSGTRAGDGGSMGNRRLTRRRTGSGVGKKREMTVVRGGPLRMREVVGGAREMLGKGDLGAAYKRAVGDGRTVVLKRMRDLNRVGEETFDAEMRRFGKLSHRNVLPPMAYYDGGEEKLLVFEYVPKGSLLYILHGERGANHALLDWPTRLKIIRGIASGMVYIHTELAYLDVPHGNLKSGNVLLAHDFEPLLTDYGYISMVNPSRAPLALFAYKSPEFLELRRVSPKSDVYCLGVVILEVLTGKFPSMYLNNTMGGTDIVRLATSAVSMGREAQLLDPKITVDRSAVPFMERMLRVGAACVQMDPTRRPDMKEAAASVEEVAFAAENSVWSPLSLKIQGEEEAFSFAHSLSQNSEPRCSDDL